MPVVRQTHLQQESFSGIIMIQSPPSYLVSRSIVLFLMTACLINCLSCGRRNENSEFTSASQQSDSIKSRVSVPNEDNKPNAQRNPVSKAFETLCADGAAALEDGDNDAAIAAYTKAIEIDSKSAQTLNARGVAYLRLQKLNLALQDFDSAITVDSTVPKYLANRALVYADKRQYERSITDLTSAIERDPNNPNWYRQRSDVYKSQGDEARARDDTMEADRLENSAIATPSFDASGSLGGIQIVTRGRLAFREGKSEYVLGMKFSDFQASFGPAEKSEKSDGKEGYLMDTVTHYYVNDGLLVTANNENEVIGFIFYVTPSTTLKAAKVSTDTGIVTGASVREIMRSHGEPFKKKEFKNDRLGYEELKLYYKYDDLVLSFRFDHGLFKSIAMNANYLPYLNE